jgi:hypothetical protein
MASATQQGSEGGRGEELFPHLDRGEGVPEVAVHQARQARRPMGAALRPAPLLVQRRARCSLLPLQQLAAPPPQPSASPLRHPTCPN